VALANQVAIIGTGTIRFGENLHQSYTDMVLGRAGRMQVARARMGLAHTLGGSGAVSCVAVLGQP